MPFPSVTYTFANSTTADASQVNQNFTDLINGLSDGTKNLSVSAGTFAGTLTAQGNVVLGNSSSNTVTFTASLASTINIGTTFSYDIGSTTIGLRALYLGDAGSAARCTKIIGATIGAGYTITTPTAVPAITNSVLVGDTSAVLSFAQRTVNSVSGSKTTTYSILTSDEVVRCDASSASFTATLPDPTASGMTGKRIRIIRTDQNLDKAVTIAHNASETINGASSITLNTQYEVVELITDGTNWFILSHTYPSGWIAYTPTFAGFGTVSSLTAYYRRTGDSIAVSVNVTTGTCTAVTATCSIPSGLTISSTALTGTALVGSAARSANAAIAEYIIATAGTSVVNFSSQSSGTNALTAFTGTNYNNSEALSFNFVVPISGWLG